MVVDSFTTQMFRLLTAFDSNVWMLTVLSVLVSGPLMTFLERGHGRSDFAAHRRDGSMHQVGQGLYLSAMGLSEHDFFTSVTPAGRLYSAFKALMLFLLMAFYDAKLCAFLSLPTKPQQAISSIDDVVTSGLPVCSRTHSNTFNYIKAAYPSVYRSLVSPGKPNFYNSSMLEYPDGSMLPAGVPPPPGVAASWSMGQALQAVQSGRCAAVINVDLDLLFEMSPENDPTGSYCNLEPVGNKFGVDYYYALSFGLNKTSWSDAQLEAFSTIMAFGQDSLAYQTAADVYFPQTRPQCAALDKIESGAVDAHGTKTLGLVQLSGIFVVLAAGSALAVLMRGARWVVVHWRSGRLGEVGRFVSNRVASTDSSRSFDEESEEKHLRHRITDLLHRLDAATKDMGAAPA